MMALRIEDDHAEQRTPQRGDRIEVVAMEPGYPNPLASGTRGTVYHVDQVQILVKWDNGRTLALVPGRDLYRIV